MKKIQCVVLLVIMAIIANIVVPISYVKAATTQNIQIKNRGTMSYFSYEGELIGQKYLMHEQDGSYHPVYRISTQAEDSPESIQAQVGNEVVDKKLYQLVKAGYPYQSAAELGCSSDFNAYVATQTAIDCYIRGYELEKLEPVSETAQSMKTAIEKIYQNANAISQKPKLSMEVQALGDWKLIDNKEMQKDFQIACNQDDAIYTVNTTDNAVHIKNAQDEEKSSFSTKEIFKLVVTKEDLAQERNWDTTIHVEAKIKDIYQTQSTNNGRTYLLCGYQFTQEGQVTFSQMLEAYQEKPEEKPSEVPGEKPEEKPNEGTDDNSGVTEDDKQDTIVNNSENTEDKKAQYLSGTSKKNTNNILPKTGF